MLDLRPYQTEALRSVVAAYKAGRRRVLVSLPTGTGKTVVFAHFPSTLRMKKRLLVLAHRDELLLQAQDKLRAVNPELRVEIEQAGSRASDHADVVVASVPTLGRAGSTRLARLDPDQFSVIVVDEAHHAVAPTYRRILDHFRLFDAGTPRLLVGFTATPRRGDQQGLGQVFEEVCFAKDLREMIVAGYLAPVRGWRVATGVSLDTVRLRHGDFVESQLADVVNTAARNDVVIKAYMDLAEGRRSIVFCVNVAHARTAQAAFEQAGIRSAAVWGAQPRDERRDTLARFSRGELDVVTNCNILTEGFDEPRVDCIIMARPTRSTLLYAQMVGRGTRLHPAKSDLLVVDIADNSKLHQLPGLHSLFDLPANMDLKGREALAVEREIEQLQRTQPWIDTTRMRTPDDLVLAVERIDFFNFEVPEELGATENSWYAVPGGGYRLSLPDGQWLAITPNLLDFWEVEQVSPHDRVLIHCHRSLETAVRLADQFVNEKFPDAFRLLQRDARWRDQPPTGKQQQMLGSRGIHVPEGVTRGQAAQMISMLLALR